MVKVMSKTRPAAAVMLSLAASVGAFVVPSSIGIASSLTYGDSRQHVETRSDAVSVSRSSSRRPLSMVVSEGDELRLHLTGLIQEDIDGKWL